MRDPFQLALLKLGGLVGGPLGVLLLLLVHLLLADTVGVEESHPIGLGCLLLLLLLWLLLRRIAALLVRRPDWLNSRVVAILLYFLLLALGRQVVVDRILNPSEAESPIEHGSAVFFISLAEPRVLVQLSKNLVERRYRVARRQVTQFFLYGLGGQLLILSDLVH